MNTIAPCDQFETIRIGENLVANYNELQKHERTFGRMRNVWEQEPAGECFHSFLKLTSTKHGEQRMILRHSSGSYLLFLFQQDASTQPKMYSTR